MQVVQQGKKSYKREGKRDWPSVVLLGHWEGSVPWRPSAIAVFPPLGQGDGRLKPSIAGISAGNSEPWYSGAGSRLLCFLTATSEPSQPQRCQNSHGVMCNEPVLTPCLPQQDTGSGNSQKTHFFPRAPAGELLLGLHVGCSPGSSPCHPASAHAPSMLVSLAPLPQSPLAPARAGSVPGMG